jgi:filamentous hemagglutinin
MQMFTNKSFKSLATKIFTVTAITTTGLLLSVQMVFSSSPVKPVLNVVSNWVAQAVKPLEVGTYKAMSSRAVVGDTLTPDHIPSGAAVVKAYELKNNTVVKKDSTLYNTIYGSANTIVYSGAIHMGSSRTYGGRNTDAQILQDAKDLKGAFTRDTQAIRQPLINSGLKAADVDAAFQKLDALNKASGLY